MLPPEELHIYEEHTRAVRSVAFVVVGPNRKYLMSSSIEGVLFSDLSKIIPAAHGAYFDFVVP